MFKVEVDSIAAYLAFDPARRDDLEALGQIIEGATRLTRYFHTGTPAGQPGMRFKMIGFGRTMSDRGVEWPLIGVALQKNYISVYLPKAAVEPYRGRLGEVRMGQGNFSFVRFGDLDLVAVGQMLADVPKHGVFV